MAASASAAARKLVVDVHSHLYPSAYIELLKKRTDIPYVRPFPPTNQLCLCNRPPQNTSQAGGSGGGGGGDSAASKVPPGRILHPHYYDVAEKIAFMDHHQIDVSVLSLGNPWLDFLPPADAAAVAVEINDATDALCRQHPGRLFFFGALPLSGGESVILAEVARLKTLSQARGIVMGTGGLGNGLDDPQLLPVYRALADAALPIFLHPNYGLPGPVWGPRGGAYGQVLPLALGFTMETTIALTRMFLSGAFDAVPQLQLIVAHSGGCLPFLAGRVEACIEHDKTWAAQGKLTADRTTLWHALRHNIYLDGVIFDKVGLRTAIEASGVDRVMFGTDHPFFAPLDGGETFPAMTLNRDAARDVFPAGADDAAGYDLVMGENAVRVLNLRTSDAS
ncbi:amidohydrolase [Niveomyces insectorum RCEF 264]|uniref:Amidohydrolase n=1 Tax=Niveomyces insectorum RCEF 264 TaxID=1081102 RepID=A0A167W4V5_9HYPO|nr:amidohydrolase [Niveomyces insectorum RCEF 264]